MLKLTKDNGTMLTPTATNANNIKTNFVEELLCLAEDVLQLGELGIVLLQHLLIVVNLAELLLQLFECCLNVNGQHHLFDIRRTSRSYISRG